MAKVIGKQHRKLIDGLGEEWLQRGPVVCFVEGFPGTGKTNILYPNIRERAVRLDMKVVKVDVAESGESQFADFVLELAEGLSDVGMDSLSQSLVKAPDKLDRPLQAAFNAKVLIVVDEFQRALNDEGVPGPAFRKLFQKLVDRNEMPGRLLAFTNRDPQRDNWAERIRFEVLAPLSLQDGLELLESRLASAGRSDEIDTQRREDLVNWVGGNPRALELVVAALNTTPLDELVGVLPKAGATVERRVSDALVKDIERKLLKRVTAGLNAPAASLLRRASIYRRPVAREGVVQVSADSQKLDASIQVLTERFLLRQREGLYEINPIAQEVERAALRKDQSVWRDVHGVAGDYYINRFNAGGASGASRVGGDFVEARYHLVQAGRGSELGPIVRHFENYLRSEFVLQAPGRYHPVARDARELDEQIAVLSILLPPADSIGGVAKALEFHLARCLAARGHEGDVERAQVHSRRSIGKLAPVMSWQLHIDLESRVNGLEEASRAVQEAIAYLPEEGSLYLKGAKLRERAGDWSGAIDLLRQGLAAVPATRGPVPLYRAAADALAREGRPADLQRALELVRNGIEQVPPQQNAFILYQAGGNLLHRLGRSNEGLALLHKGIAALHGTSSAVALYQDCMEFLARLERVDDAMKLLRRGIQDVPKKHTLFSLYRSGTMILERVGRHSEALELLREGIASLPLERGMSMLYATGSELLARQGFQGDALDLVREGLGRVPLDHGLPSLYRLAIDLYGRRGQSGEILHLVRQATATFVSGEGVQGIQEAAVYNLARLPDGAINLADLSISLGSTTAGLAQVMRRQLANNWVEAAADATALREAHPRNAAVAEHQAFSLLGAQQVEEARRAFDSFPWRSDAGPNWWLGALIALSCGDPTAAQVAWARFRDQPVREVQVPTKLELLQAWDSQVLLSVPHPKYYHPILPPKLTGRTEVFVATPSLSPSAPSAPPTSTVAPKRDPLNAKLEPLGPLTWVHLSDLHACRPKTGWDARRIITTLIADLRKMEADHDLSPQLAFFTGDAAFGTYSGSKMADQYAEVAKFLEDVRKAFHREVPKENVFLVPGNHDVDRDEVGEDQTSWLSSQRDSEQINQMILRAGKQWQRYMARLGAYRNFAEGAGYGHVVTDPERLIYGQIREVCGRRVGIGGFNSAWSCGGDGEKGHLWLGGKWQEATITSALVEADLRVALIHHPHNWFVEEEDPILKRQFESSFDFLLHGHEHTNWVERVDGHIRIAAGACYDRSDRPNGYNLVRIDPAAGNVEVWLRRYDPQGGGWVPNAIANKTNNDGRWLLPLGGHLKSGKGAA
jgi:tetratricopeptide (TPR) repeat protein/predicted MPP superfamily phosphohydrolase